MMLQHRSADIYVPDACIARLFRLTSGVYIPYMNSLLSSFPSRPTMVVHDRKIFVCDVQPTAAAASNHWISSMPGETGYLIDYEVDESLGEIIPQKLWLPAGSEGNVRRLVDKGVLQQPIFFLRRNGGIGISLVEANAGATSHIAGENDFANLGGKTTKHLCLNWVGYSEFRKQIETQDAHKRPITLGRLVHRVGRHVDSFLRVMHEHRILQDPFWASYFGSSWSRLPAIDALRQSIVIIGLIHASQGVWQPVLQVHGLHPSNVSP